MSSSIKSGNHGAFSERDLMPVIEELVKGGGECNLVVTGYSMVPTLKHKRDSVILVSPKKRRSKRGDIVLIKRNSGKYILHRVVKVVNNDHIIINGDSQMWGEVASTGQIIGVAKAIVRKNKQISCSNPIYRLYSSVWMLCRPFRGSIFKLRSRVKKEDNLEKRRK